jgi:hypothetical protein
VREELASCKVVADSVAKSLLKGLEAAWPTGVRRPELRAGRIPDVRALSDGNECAKKMIATTAAATVHKEQESDQRLYLGMESRYDYEDVRALFCARPLPPCLLAVGSSC